MSALPRPSSLAALRRRILSGSLPRRQDHLAHWKTLALLSAQTGSSNAAEDAAREAPNGDDLNAKEMSEAIRHSALIHLSKDDNTLENKRESWSRRTLQLRKETVEEERKSLTVDLALSWSLGGHSDIAKDATCRMLGRLGDQPYLSRKTFARITTERLTEIMYLIACVQSINKFGRFHKYYALYKVWEHVDSFGREDLALIFLALRRHRIVVERNHPLYEKFSRKMFDKIAEGDLGDDLKTIENVYRYFDMAVPTPEMVQKMWETQKRLQGGEVPERFLLWMGHYATRAGASKEQSKEIADEIANRIEVLPKALDCGLASSILTSSWLADEQRPLLARAIAESSQSILERQETGSLLLPVLKAVLTLGILHGEHLRPELVSAVLEHPMLTCRIPQDPPGSVRIRRNILFSTLGTHSVSRSALVHLWQIALIRFGQEDFSKLPKLFLDEWKGTWLANEDDYDAELAEKLHPLRRHFATVLLKVKDEIEEKYGCPVEQETNFPFFDCVELIFQDGEGRKRAVVLMDKALYLSSSLAGVEQVERMLREYLNSKNGIERADFFDTRFLSPSEVEEAVGEFVAGLDGQVPQSCGSEIPLRKAFV